MTRDRPVRSAALSQVLGKSFLVCDVLRDTLRDGGIVKFLIWIFSFRPFGKVSLLGVIALWDDYRFNQADWGL